ncbi:MAG: ETC complex I subunit [Nitratireductor sp.]|nr:ETC complex I subunit [Nitratireductor sp.]
MTARIYSPAKTAMQSGRAKTHGFILEFEPATARRIEPLMGYTSSSDTMQQVRLRFDTLEQAKAYCEKHSISYFVQMPQEPRRRRASYSDNFSFDRKQPWTH